MTPDFVPVSRRCLQVTDNSLNPSGSLSMRLNQDKPHMPGEAKKNARCSLHRWAGTETELGVMRCTTCNVSLCLKCWIPFHQQTYILDSKEVFKRK